MTDEAPYDVCVIGAGPAGAAAAYWLARAGRRVVVVERKAFPRDKTCGDGLTPRAVHQLSEMGLAERLEGCHRCVGLRALGHGMTLELAWPQHPVFPSHGYVVRRNELDQFVADNAAAAGAELRFGVEALGPRLVDGAVRGALVQAKGADAPAEIAARYVVVADGANSRVARALGCTRNRRYPQGMAIRGYWQSPRHDDAWIESSLDVRDRAGNVLPGYGWVFPVGDGTVNVGVGLLSTFRDYKSVNTSRLLAEYAATAPAYWGLSEGGAVGRPTGGRLPMAGSVEPKHGPGFLVVGDAAGSVNPFNGEGIDYAYETGRLAAELIDEALGGAGQAALDRYPALLDAEYGLYFKVARLFAKVIGRPALMRELTRVGLHSRPLMEWVLRIMANLLRPDELGPAEAAYKAVAAVVRLVPERTA